MQPRRMLARPDNGTDHVAYRCYLGKCPHLARLRPDYANEIVSYLLNIRADYPKMLFKDLGYHYNICGDQREFI
jgi:hypothetical protein